MKSQINHSIANYEALLDLLLRESPRELAMARAVGSQSIGDFSNTGDIHIEILRHHGLADGMRIYDLGCGSGRTAQALERAGWSGEYLGADIVPRLVEYLNATCRTKRAIVNRSLTIRAEDAALDLLYHWSVFTHLFPEECFVYMQDIARALKPGGAHVFSFMEMEDDAHYARIFKLRVKQFADGRELSHLDTFLHRDWIRTWARELGFSEPEFTDGSDERHHRRSWQTIASMRKRP